MNRKMQFSYILLVAPFLMGATSVPTTYSAMLEYQIKGTVLQSGSQTVTVNSTRNQLMGTAVMNYELIYTGHPPYGHQHKNEWRYYTINYRLDLYPENGVKYANGLWNMFTETGNTAVKGAKVSVKYFNAKDHLATKDSFDGNKAFKWDGAVTGDYYSYYDLCLPKDNVGFYGTEIQGAQYFFQDEGTINSSQTKVSYSGNKVKTADERSVGTRDSNDNITSTTTVDFMNRPRKTNQNPCVSFYGCYEFCSANSSDTLSITYETHFIIAENSSYGSCKGDTPSTTINISWQRPEAYY